jgi:predicted small metal-binding protein
LRQPAANIDPTCKPYNAGINDRREQAMAKRITCECGQVINGSTEDEVVDGAREHMRADHPELLEKVSREDLVGWIEEV